jgi:hypothetical protein
MAYVKNLRISPSGRKVTATQKCVLQLLAEDHNVDLGFAWSSVEYLAERACMTIRNCRKVTAACELRGIIRRISTRRNSDGGQSTNEYEFVEIPCTRTPAQVACARKHWQDVARTRIPTPGQTRPPLPPVDMDLLSRSVRPRPSRSKSTAPPRSKSTAQDYVLDDVVDSVREERRAARARTVPVKGPAKASHRQLPAQAQFVHQGGSTDASPREEFYVHYPKLTLDSARTVWMAIVAGMQENPDYHTLKLMWPYRHQSGVMIFIHENPPVARVALSRCKDGITEAWITHFGRNQVPVFQV